MSNILLVGNGPNYFSKGVSWTDVVRATAKHVRIQNQVERLIKEPLPMVYERIATQFPAAERSARKELARVMKEMLPNEIHNDLMGLNWRTVLTTNYDNCLEKATGDPFRAANLASETTYSVFRRKCSKRQAVWHIHGERSGPRTMMLGLHEYAGQLQKLRGYLTSRQDGSPFVNGTAADIEQGRHSWADLFLRDDVHIVGLGLGYAEVVLWWLMSYKQRLRFVKKLKCGQTTYYTMGATPRSAVGRLELMKGLGVKIKQISPSSDRPTRSTWHELIHELQRQGGTSA